MSVTLSEAKGPLPGMASLAPLGMTSCIDPHQARAVRSTVLNPLAQ
jgi:hypothetical protein